MYFYLGPANRKNIRFKSDPNIPKQFSADNSDYLGSGWSRGHMAPAGDNKNSQVSYFINYTFVTHDKYNADFVCNCMFKVNICPFNSIMIGRLLFKNLFFFLSDFSIKYYILANKGLVLELWCSTTLSTIFQLYRGGQFNGVPNNKKMTYCKSLTNFIT